MATRKPTAPKPAPKPVERSDSLSITIKNARR